MPILEQSWLNKLNILKINEAKSELYINKVTDNELTLTDKIKKKYSNVFSANVEKCTMHKLSLRLKDNVKPVFCKPRPVLFAMRSKIETEIERHMANNIIEPVESNECYTYSI